MKEFYFFSCENAVIISSRALDQYPEIQKIVLPYVHGVGKEVLFFIMKESFVNKLTFNSSTIVGFASVVVGRRHARVKPLKIIPSTQMLKRQLMQSIVGFFTIPIIVEVDTSSASLMEDVKFFTSIGFGSPTVNDSNDRVVDMKQSNSVNFTSTVAAITNISKQQASECSIKVFFPQTLAHILSSYLSAPSEVGGKLCIVRYITDPTEKDIAVLGFDTATLVTAQTGGTSINIPYDQLSPFSFHTHPDYNYPSLQCFVSWPSGDDIATLAKSYFDNKNMLAHFVASSEGIWIIHARPQFQRLLYHLKQNKPATQACCDTLIDFIRSSFRQSHNMCRYDTVAAKDRLKARDNFIKVSKSLKISDFKNTNVETICASFIREDVVMFDIDLIKWKVFETNKVTMEFSYILDHVAGIQCFIPSDCGFVEPMVVE
jgi:hypothetical protein